MNWPSHTETDIVIYNPWGEVSHKRCSTLVRHVHGQWPHATCMSNKRFDQASADDDAQYEEGGRKPAADSIESNERRGIILGMNGVSKTAEDTGQCQPKFVHRFTSPLILTSVCLFVCACLLFCHGSNEVHCDPVRTISQGSSEKRIALIQDFGLLKYLAEERFRVDV